jgi:7,8-dihydropterin-6-yl-methyl-4-(beta-D-ribofuranosyl)aminobenzene 5'-phosphate synthase
MKLTVLVDNNTFIDQYYIGEPGVSYFIEADGKEVLFDVGYSNAFLTNAQKAGIDLKDIDFVVLSHGHLDHTWGLPHLVKYLDNENNKRDNTKKATLITSPATFTSRKIKKTREIGPNMTADTLSEYFKFLLSASPVFLTENLVYLGEIPRVTSFEADKPLGKVVTEKDEKPDFLLDDSALVYRSRSGLVIITGCSHSGICNLVEYAKNVMKEERILDIVGGLHLLNPSKSKLSGTLDYMKVLKPNVMHACHCTDLRSKIALANVVKLDEVGSGMVLEYL